MRTRLLPPVMALALALSAASARAETPRIGPIQERLGDELLVNLPAGYQMTGPEDGALRIEPHSADPGAVPPWSVRARYLATGHVKELDSGDERLDPDALLEGIRARSRCQRWVEPPRFDPPRHQLSWALECAGAAGPRVEQHLRVLGRGGVLALDVEVPPEGQSEARPRLVALRMALPFAEGHAWEDYRGAGEPVAQGGLAALVLEDEVRRHAPSGAGRALQAVGALVLVVALLVGLRVRLRGEGHSSG